MSASPSPRQLLHEALASLRGLGRRSLLALLGIVMGCSSVIAMLNIGSNATDEAMSIFKDMGTDTLVVQFPFARRRRCRCRRRSTPNRCSATWPVWSTWRRWACTRPR